jgi:gliding motility associated protien GldN
MSKYINQFKVILLATCAMGSFNLFAQTPTKVTEKLTKANEVSLEDVNGFSKDSSFFLKPNNKVNNRIPPKYPEFREEDMLFIEDIWEDIDGREKKNRHFLYESVDEAGERKFFKILTSILESDTANVKAYAPNNDRFTTPLKMDSVLTLLLGPVVSKKRTKDDGTIEDISFRDPTYSGADIPTDSSLYTFRLKAQYVFDNKSGRMHYRILGIAPIAIIKKTVSVPDGKGGFIDIDSTVRKTLFWISYPKIRNYLANRDVYNPSNQKNMISWSDLLEARYFDSRITKTSYNNFGNKDFFELYKDPKKRLEAAEKVKQRIDDFDQDRWVY